MREAARWILRHRSAGSDRGGRARLSGVVAAPGVRRDAGGWGDRFPGVKEPAAKVGQAALVSKSED
jgi:hypothetical protein